MKKSIACLLISTLWLGSSAPQASEVHVARCVGKFCLNVYSRARLIREYGAGYLHLGDDPTLLLHCYYDARRKLWIELEFSLADPEQAESRLTGIFLTSVPLCPVVFMPKQPLPALISEYGIGLGATELAIVSKMGPPARRDDVRAAEREAIYLSDSARHSARFGGERLVFYDQANASLLFNFYGIEAGKLISLWFSDGE